MRFFTILSTLLICFVSGGATCARRQAPMPFPPPPVSLNETPTLDEVVQVVNRTQSIHQLSTNSASVKLVSMPRVPKLGATLSLQRPRDFRLRASLPIVLGSGLDMGSNDELFWFEVPEGMSKTLYYARHDQYRQQLRRAILPVDPTWVMDALGLVQIDPKTVVAGPVVREDGRLEIRSTISMPDGIYQRVCLIEPTAGYVTHQFLYSPTNQLIAQSQASNHVWYEAQNVALPHLVEIHLTPAIGPPLQMKIEVGQYTVNQLLSGDPNLFAMPQTASKAVDLTTLGNPPANQVTPVSYAPTPSNAYPYRGSHSELQ